MAWKILKPRRRVIARSRAAPEAARGSRERFKLSSSVVRLTNTNTIDTEPNFSPDGQYVIFTSDRGGSPQIYRVPVSGGQAERLTFEGTYNVSPRFSPDGKSFVFIQRNGVPVSPYAVMHEYFMRHGDRLVLITQILDPVYLEEPFIRTSHWTRNSNITLDQRFIFEVVDEVAAHPPGYVPHYPLGARHMEYADENKLPLEATLGGGETLYPEYQEKLKQLMKTGGTK